LKDISVDSPASGFKKEQRFHLPARNTINFDALCSAAVSAENSNSRVGPFQKSGKEFAKRFIGAIFNRWRTKPDFDGAFGDAGDFVAARTWLNANVKDNRTSRRLFQDLQIGRGIHDLY